MAGKKTDDETQAEHPKVAAVRKVANALLDAITGARKAGFAVTLPSRAEELPSIAISETGTIREDEGDALTGTEVETQTITP